MLNKYNKGLVLALLTLSLGTEVYSQSINNLPLLGINNSDEITLTVNDISPEEAIRIVCEHFNLKYQFQQVLCYVVSNILNVYIKLVLQIELW